MKTTRALIVAAALGALASSLTACSNAPQSDIGLVDTLRIQANWPKFQNYQNQLAVDAQTIDRSNKPAGVKARERAELQKRFTQDQSELTDDVRNAAQQVATQKHLTYVLTRQFVGYGGVDITPDVEKILNIVEKPSPTP